MTASAPGISGREDPRLDAAQRRLRESGSEADALEAIREIVTNLLGCEEIGLFTVDQGRSGLYWSFGIDAERHGTLDAFEESGLQRVLRGELYVVQTVCERQGNHAKPPIRVFVPIRASGRTVAVLVMLKLLPQKLDFDESDLKLVNLLSDEAGRALFGGGSKADA